jgi:hypothetical protein
MDNSLKRPILRFNGSRNEHVDERSEFSGQRDLRFYSNEAVRSGAMSERETPHEQQLG